MLNIVLTHAYIKKQAAILRDFLRKNNVELSMNNVLEVLSRSYGHKNWNTLSGALTREVTPSNTEENSFMKEFPADDEQSAAAMYYGDHGACMRKKPLGFHIYTNETDNPKEQEGVFALLESVPWEKLDKEFDALRRKFESNESTLGEFMDGAIDILIAAELHYLNAYAYIGRYLFGLRYFREATSWYRAGIKIGKSIIKKHNHPGRITWGSSSNQPFLYCHQGLILSLLELSQKEEACQLMEEHLRWNPSDNLGIKSLIGPTYLSLGKTTKARKYLKQAQNYPEAQYMLALLEFRSGNFVEAATTLRKAFLSNEYMAEILLGNPNPGQRLVYHHYNMRRVEWAKEKLTDNMAYLWRDTKNAMRFLDWMYHGSLALKDRVHMRKCDEIRSNTKLGDPERNTAAFLDINITKKETAEIIKKGFNRYERENWPWEEDAINGEPWRKGEEPDWVKEQMQQP